jgi:hypothetical protein
MVAPFGGDAIGICFSAESVEIPAQLAYRAVDLSREKNDPRDSESRLDPFG